MVQVTLSRSRENSRSAAGRRRQVSIAQKVSVAEDDLGRRRDRLLLQRTIEKRPEGMLHEKSISHAGREEKSREEDRPDADSGV